MAQLVHDVMVSNNRHIPLGIPTPSTTPAPSRSPVGSDPSSSTQPSLSHTNTAPLLETTINFSFTPPVPGPSRIAALPPCTAVATLLAHFTSLTCSRRIITPRCLTSGIAPATSEAPTVYICTTQGWVERARARYVPLGEGRRCVGPERGGERLRLGWMTGRRGGFATRSTVHQ